MKKWLWMDPTFNAYVKDENGNFLSIEEVRERMIADKSLVLNADANCNNQPWTKERYLDAYMAKNLYWLQCPANSYFNVESRYRNINEMYVSLMPLGYERSDMRTLNVVTCDPNYFWQTPE